MKKYVFSSLILLLSSISLSGHTTLRQQLEQVNIFWKNRCIDDRNLRQVVPVLAERDLITRHLSLVEHYLRCHSNLALDNAQWEKRIQCLDVLRKYYLRGVFPRNGQFCQRTPVFIDEDGIACAVGHMIIESGYANYAHKIRDENNFGHLPDLAKKYQGISTWAEEFGFSTEELAWIQPCYSYSHPDTPGVKHPSCFDGRNGYFYPDFSSTPNIYETFLERKIGGSWTKFVDWCGDYRYEFLNPGEYRWGAKVGANDVHYFYQTLSAPEPAKIEALLGGDYTDCTASATIQVTGGATPIRYSWQARPDTVAAVFGLCESFQSVTVYEAANYWCSHYMAFFVGPLGGDSYVESELSISPNPSSDRVVLKSPEIFNGAVYIVLDQVGTVFLQGLLTETETDIDVDDLSAGMYTLIVKSPRGEIVRKLIRI